MFANLSTTSKITAMNPLMSLADVVLLCPTRDEQASALANLPLLRFCGSSVMTRLIEPWVLFGFKRIFVCHDSQSGSTIAASEEALETIADTIAATHKMDVTSVALINVPVKVGDENFERAAMREVSSAKAEQWRNRRDTVVVQCGALLTVDDVRALVYNFYASASALSVLLWEPAQSEGKGGKESESDSKDKVPEPDSRAICAALENEGEQKLCIGAPSRDSIAHYRLHLLASEHDFNLTTGFVARRPNLLFHFGLRSSGAFIIQPQLLSRIMDSWQSTAEAWTSIDVFVALYCRSQHMQVFKGQDTYETYTQAAQTSFTEAAEMTSHWTSASADEPHGRFYARQYNAMQSAMPSDWDVLRVSATVVREAGRRRVIKIISLADYIAAILDEVRREDVSPEEAEVRRSAQTKPHWKNSLVLAAEELKKCTVINSFIAPNVTIGQFCVIRNSVILEGAVLGEKCKLDGCIVSSNSVLNGCDFRNVVVSGEEAPATDDS